MPGKIARPLARKRLRLWSSGLRFHWKREKKLNTVRYRQSLASWRKVLPPPPGKTGLEALRAFFLTDNWHANCNVFKVWEPTLIASLSPGLIAAPQTRNRTFTARARMCARPTRKWSLVLQVRYPLWVCMWGCCGGVLLRIFPEKSIIYLELSQCCVVFCRRGLPMVQKPSHRPDVYRLAFTRVKCCFSWFFNEGSEPERKGAHLYTPLPTCCFVWPEGYGRALGLDTKPLGAHLSTPDTHFKRANCVAVLTLRNTL